MKGVIVFSAPPDICSAFALFRRLRKADFAIEL